MDFDKWRESSQRLFPISKEMLFGPDTGAPLRESLYHFTDAKGLIGIVDSKKLWASRATCLNDASEVLYGVQIALDLLSERFDKAKSLLYRRALRGTTAHFLRETMGRPSHDQLVLRPHVVSLCSKVRSSAHWSTYGRSGRGYALEFEPIALKTDVFQILVPTRYDLEEQKSLIARFLNAYEEEFLTATHGWTDDDRARFGDMSAEIFAMLVWGVAARFKDPSFTAEDEWRLIGLDTVGKRFEQNAGIPTPSKFRESDGRVVPYWEVDYSTKGLPLKSITLGYSIATDENEEAVRFLLRERGVPDSVSIHRSDVRLR